jgi:hypothetical protein
MQPALGAKFGAEAKLGKFGSQAICFDCGRTAIEMAGSHQRVQLLNGFRRDKARLDLSAMRFLVRRLP